MSNSAWKLFAVSSLLYAGAASAVTSTIGEVDKLLASDGELADYMGRAIAIDSDTAILGAYGDDDLGNESGAAYIFTRDASGVWSMQQKLSASDGAADDRFGWTVAIDGDTAVVGRESWDFFAPPPGAAYVFTRDASGVWSEQQKLTAYDGAAGDYYGESVAISGNTIVVGARGDDDLGDNSGSVYIYTNDGSGVWALQQKLNVTGQTENDLFGSEVELDGDTAVIAAYGYDYSGTISNSGAAYVFTRDTAGIWSEQQMLTPDDNASNKGFAGAVALSGDNAAIGAWGDDATLVNGGAVYLYSRDGSGNWSQQQKLSASDMETGDYFGFSVAIEGDRLIAGAGGADDNGTDAGAVYFFSDDGTGVWSEQRKLLASDGLDYDYLAYAVQGVDLSGNTVVAGAQLDDTLLGANTGSGYVFDITQVEGPNVSTSTSLIDFGELRTGDSAQRTITISNTGTEDLAIASIGLTSGVYYSQSNDCPATLTPSAACQSIITFSPTADGTFSDDLVIQSSDPDQPVASVALTGSGTSQLPDLAVASLVSADSMVSGSTETVSVTVANQGVADIAWGYWVNVYMDGIMIGGQYVFQTPSAGGEVLVDIVVGVPAPSQLPLGSHTLTVVIDDNDEVMELDEGNNTASKVVTTTRR